MRPALPLALLLALGIVVPVAAQDAACPAYELWRGGDDAVTLKWADALGFSTQPKGASINDPKPIRISVEPALNLGEGKFRSAIKRVWFQNGIATREATLFAMTCAESDLASCAAIARPKLCEALQKGLNEKGDAHADVSR